METPDKLYIGRRNYGPLIGGWKSQPFTSKEIESIEYIRKDTLIEWLLKGIEMSEICHSEYGDACAQAYQSVIDKLNSM